MLEDPRPGTSGEKRTSMPRAGDNEGRSKKMIQQAEAAKAKMYDVPGKEGINFLNGNE